MKKLTIQDVADEAGVSIATVSRVLNGNYPVNQKTRQRVEKTVKKLNFTPNSLARGLIQKKTYTIGVLVPGITNLFFSLVINGIQDFFKHRGYLIMTCDTNGDPTNEEKYLTQLLERQVDGIISVDPRTSVIKNRCYEKANEKVPVILINGYHEGVKLNYVLSDQESGAMEALEYLITLGHKNIAFIRGDIQSYSYDIKEKVYRHILEKYHIPFRDDYMVVIENGNSVETLDMAAEALTEVLSANNRPSAVFACNDWMGEGAVCAALKMGIAVPEELSIIGYDNIVISEISMPKLTTVDQNMYDLGAAAAAELFRILSEGSREGYIRLILDTKLVVRGSCAQNEKMNEQKGDHNVL